MVSFAFKPLQQSQLHLSSFSHCKHSPTLNTVKFQLSFRSLKNKPKIRAEVPGFAAQLFRGAGTGEELSRNDVFSSPKADFLSGVSSLTELSKKGGKSSLGENRIGVGERTERRVVPKDRHEKMGFNSKRRKGVGSRGSSMRVEGKHSVRKTSALKVVNEDVDKTRVKCEDSGVEVEEKEKRTKKKSKIDPPETTLRVGLDLCSKRGDVLCAIKLYDLAKKEFIKMGQYHYTVLLYLCSSAATGMVQPAKSGSGCRSLSPGDLLEESSVLGSESLSEIGELANNIHNRSKLHEQNPRGKPAIEHLDRNEFNMDDLPRKMVGNDSSSVEEDSTNFINGSMEISPHTLEGFVQSMKKSHDYLYSEDDGSKDYKIQVNKDVKSVALQKGFEIYHEMCMEKVPMNEASLTSVARMAMAFGDGDMAFDMIKQMKEHGINPRLRSYGPALAIFCNEGDVEKAFMVKKHMLEHGVHPEEPELEALLKASIEAGKSDKVYYLLHKLRTTVRQVSSATADSIESWFKSKVASRVGKRKWDQELIIQALENGGGGWHGKGWLGNGKWTVCHSTVGSDGLCKSCGVKLVTVDLDPEETEKFAKSVASIAAQREKHSSFQKFQEWLDYYGPFEAVVDAANVGFYSQRRFKPSKVNAVVNGIRQTLPSRKWPLIVLHNRRIAGGKMDEPFNRSLIEKWKNADALYATPSGSNDDWYWLYAAIKCRCLLVTNDEMRDHLFQLLGNDFFPKWKERHQVRFSFTETGPIFHMPPPCSVVIQESEKGHWHIPVVSQLENEDERIWLCCTRPNSNLIGEDSSAILKESHQKQRQTRIGAEVKYQAEAQLARQTKHNHSKHELQELSSNVKSIVLPSMLKNYGTSILLELETAEKLGGCLIDFQI